MGKKILVFGGLGFIGSNFVRWSLVERPEFEVNIVDGHTYAADLSRLPRTFNGEVRNALLQEPSKYEDMVTWADVVINFAAETHNDNSLHYPEIFVDTNIVGTSNLLGVCRDTNTPLVQISTDEVFGDFAIDSHETATEKYPYRPSSPYSASKASADLLVLAWVRSFGVQAIITHCTNNFGPNQHPEKFIPNAISKIRNKLPVEIYGDGQNIRDWIHVDDHSSAIATLLEKGIWGETYNISSGEEYNNLSLVTLVAKCFGHREYPISFIPDRPGHDRRYGLDSSKLRALGWAPTRTVKGFPFENL